MISRKDKFFLAFWAFIMILCFSFYLVAYFPATMSQDSLSQWYQMTTFKFNDWHPVISTLFYFVCTSIWNSPASVAIAQILILTGIYLSGMLLLVKMNVNKVVITVCVILFALYPANGFIAMTLWKDVMYSIMLLWITIILLQILLTKGAWMDSRNHKIAFVVCSLGLIFFRHNGLLTFAAVIFVLVLVFRKYAKQFVIISMVVLAIYIVVSGPGFKLMGVVSEPSVESLGIPTMQVAAIISCDGEMTKSQEQFFNRILPMELWKSGYNGYCINQLKFNSKFDTSYVTAHKKEFIINWISLILNNPNIAFKAYLKQTSMIWRIKPYDDSYTYTIIPGIIDNDLGLKNIKISYKARELADNILLYTQSSLHRMEIFWRPALWLYSAIAAGIITAMFLGKEYLILLMPIFSNSFAFMLATPAQDYRYQYANFIIALFIIPLAVSTAFFRQKGALK